MSRIPTVAMAELAAPCSLPEALESWSGFAQAIPASLSQPSVPYLILPNASGEDWQWAQVPEQVLAPVGCSFLRDLEVSGSGYVFNQGRFVREFVNISDTALRWLEQDLHDHPLAWPRTNRIVIEEPVLLVFGPGSNIYGHWLLDFLPRIFIAQQLMGAALDDFLLLLPSDSPEWVTRMIYTFCGIEATRFRYYSRNDDVVICRRACLPSYAHSGKRGDYAMHPVIRTFYNRFGNPGGCSTKRRVCLSRSGQERKTHGTWRIFEAREMMEHMAAERGFAVVQPETLSFSEQVALFRSADCILGEHGSGMHAAVFADPGTIVATVGAWNRHQFQIAASFGHRSICMARHQVIQGWEQPPFRFTAAEDDLVALFEMTEIIQASGRADFRRPATDPKVG